MLFETRGKAENFIRFNRESILDESGRAPVRSYYCPFCCGWHVTSNPSGEEGSKMDSRIEKKVRSLEMSIARRKEERVLENTLTPSLSSAIEKAKKQMYCGRLDKAEGMLSKTLFEIRLHRASNPGWCRGGELEERVMFCLGLISRARETFDDPEAEKGVLESDSNTPMDRFFRDMVRCNVTARDIERLIADADRLLDLGRKDEAEDLSARARDLFAQIRKVGIKSPRPALERRLDSLEKKFGRLRRHEPEMHLAIEKAKDLLATGKLDEAQHRFEAVRNGIEDLGIKDADWPKGVEMKKRIGDFLDLIARARKTYGDQEAEKAVMDSRPEREEDVLFKKMVTIRSVTRDMEALSSEVENLLRLGHGKEAEKKLEEIRKLIGRLKWTGVRFLRASLEDELDSLEWKVAKVLGPERKRTPEERKLLVAAIERATLADRARKDGNGTLCRNFVSEAKAILDKVANCEEKETVKAFLSAMGAWSGDIPDGPGKSAKAVTV
jgi:hypothetical protein